MNYLFLGLVIILTFGIFGFPVWNLAFLRGKQHPLWLLVPPSLFLGLFALSNLLENAEAIGWYMFVRDLSFYWMIIGMMLFGFTLLGMLMYFVFKVSKRYIFWGIVIVTLVYAGIAIINGHRVVVKELSLPAQNISREYNFIHITDLHSGSTNRDHAQKVVDMIAGIDPEFVVITGDFIDEFYVTSYDIEPFNDLSMPVYLITGNHEYYLEEDKIFEVIEGTKIQLIDGMRITYEELDIIGVNELASIESTLSQLGGIDESRYSILLDHQPKEDEAQLASSKGVHLMLSGHTHEGQIWPMKYLVQLQFMYVGGLYEVGEMFLYVNQGTGTLGPKMRIGTVNEITDISLIQNK
jgi:predicted MPP superfamily phosphohydrolase